MQCGGKMLKLVIELEESISEEDAEGAIERFQKEPWAKNVYVESAKCIGCKKTSTAFNNGIKNECPSNQLEQHVSLLPCPFCGNKAELIRIPEPQYWYGVKCTNCGANIKKSNGMSVPVDCVRKWNTRQSG
jgi:hypothetical protein